jgi:hypothetical protein
LGLFTKLLISVPASVVCGLTDPRFADTRVFHVHSKLEKGHNMEKVNKQKRSKMQTNQRHQHPTATKAVRVTELCLYSVMQHGIFIAPSTQTDSRKLFVHLTKCESFPAHIFVTMNFLRYMSVFRSFS